MRQAVRKAQTAPGARDLVLNASHNLLDIWFGLIPAVLFVGWIGLALVEHTPIVDWPALPFVYLLEVLRDSKRHRIVRAHTPTSLAYLLTADTD